MALRMLSSLFCLLVHMQDFIGKPLHPRRSLYRLIDRKSCCRLDCGSVLGRMLCVTAFVQ